MNGEQNVDPERTLANAAQEAADAIKRFNAIIYQTEAPESVRQSNNGPQRPAFRHRGRS